MINKRRVTHNQKVGRVTSRHPPHPPLPRVRVLRAGGRARIILCVVVTVAVGVRAGVGVRGLGRHGWGNY